MALMNTMRGSYSGKKSGHIITIKGELFNAKDKNQL